jgi:hypothetical protein
MPEVVAELPKHLIPKKPRNVKDRILWRRKVHKLRLAYQRHMNKMLAIKNVQDFRTNVLRAKLINRGISWKQQNLSLLNGNPE